jgi:hypothetical protein
VSLRRIVFVVGIVFYVMLWVLALNGVSSLIAPLTIPVVLAVLVAGGVQLNKFLGLSPRKQHFHDGEDEPKR